MHDQPFPDSNVLTSDELALTGRSYRSDLSLRESFPRFESGALWTFGRAARFARHVSTKYQEKLRFLLSLLVSIVGQSAGRSPGFLAVYPLEE